MKHSKSLVANCPDSEPLRLQLVRGTSVLVDHEAVLTELCANPDTSDAETEQCVLDYLQGGYESLDDDATTTTIDSRSSSINGDMPTNGGGVLLVDTNGDTQNISADDDTERNLALDNLHSLWAEDFSSTVQSASLSTQSESSPSSSVVNPKPWSSRSSPSGTFVRDPGTGRMRNID